MDFFLVIGTIFAVCIFFLLPGFLLREVLRKKIEINAILGLGLGFALIIFIFVFTTVLYRYNFWLSLIENIVLILLLAGLYFRRESLQSLRSFRYFRILYRKVSNELHIFSLFIFVFFLLMAPIFMITVPFDTDAQGFGQLSLAVREGGTLYTLAPYYPEISYVYSPAYFILVAYLSDMFSAPIHEVMLILSHFTAFLFVILMFEFGKSVKNNLFGIILALCVVIGTGMLTSLMDAHYTVILGLLLTATFLTMFFKNMRKPDIGLTLLCGFVLGAICLSHPDTLIILLIAFVPFYITVFLSKERISRLAYFRSFVLMPFIGVLFASPWLLKVFKLFFAPDIMSSPFRTDISHWINIIVFQGGLLPILAFLGLFLALKKRRFEDIFMLTWIVFIIELSLIGLFEKLGLLIHFDFTQHFYPFGISWEGPIIPFAFLGGMVIYSQVFKRKVFLKKIKRASSTIFIILTFFVFAGTIIFPLVIPLTHSLSIPIVGTFSTDADVDMMLWVKENTGKDDVVLNYPASLEGHWVPVISERKTIGIRSQPFFTGYGKYRAIDKNFADSISQSDLDTFHRLLDENNVSWIIVPQLSMNDYTSINSLHWEKSKFINMSRFLLESDKVKLVKDINGAQAYKVIS